METPRRMTGGRWECTRGDWCRALTIPVLLARLGLRVGLLAWRLAARAELRPGEDWTPVFWASTCGAQGKLTRGEREEGDVFWSAEEVSIR